LYAGLTVARQRQTVLCLLQARLANRGMILFSGRLSIHSSVIKLVNMIFWKRMNRFCCKLVWVVHPPGAWNDQFSGQEVKGQRSRFYTRPLLGMLTSLDWHESENFFSRLRIKFLEVEYREMTLGHTQCAWKTRSVWMPDRGWLAGHPGKDGSNCLWSPVSWVACTDTVFYDALSVFSSHLFTCTLSDSCAHISDPISLDWNHGLYNLWLKLAVAGHVCLLVTLPEASTARDCTDLHT